MSLDPTKLENIRTMNGRTEGACPACREAGSDKTGNHLLIYPDGRFGCVMHPNDEAHRRRIFALAGMKSEAVAKPQHTTKRAATIDDTITGAMGWDKGLKGGKETRRDFYTPDFLEVRFDFPDGRAKEYRPFHRNGAGWKMGDPPGTLPLFGRDELPDSGRVYVCEGPKCRAALAELGLCSTTSAHGSKSASKSEWTPLAGRDVCILPDNDEAGRKYAEAVAGILMRLDPPASVRVVALPGLSHGEDVFDFIEHGGTLEQIESLADSAPIAGRDWMKSALTAAEIGAMELPELRFLIPGILPEGLNILAGRPKIGKSWLSLDFALAVAYGGRAVGSLLVEKSAVLYLAMEDGTRRMKDRLRHITRDDLPDGLTFFFEWPRTDEQGLERLDAWLAANPACRFVIIDTLQKIKARTRFNVNAYDGDYAALEGLQRLAINRRVCILLVHHLRKAAGDDILDSVSGSTGLTGYADAVLILERGRGNADAVLHVTGRDVSEQRLALQFEGGRWQLLGDAVEHAVSDTRRKILDTLAAGPMTPKELAETTGVNHGNIRVLLGKMVEAGQINKTEDHRYAALTVNSINSYTPSQPELLTVLTCKGVNAVNDDLDDEPRHWELDL